LAELSPEQAAKSRLLAMACSWQRLADQAVRNSKTELGLRTSEAYSAVTATGEQQQQQIRPKK
jgi:hypothetical protein